MKYLAFLRGINVGGHHKVPMVELKALMKKMGFENTITLLNSGNIIFETTSKSVAQLEETLSQELENHFGFPIPTIIRRAEAIKNLHASNPFADITMHPDIRLYISFLKKESPSKFEIPWQSEDHSFKILQTKDQAILSVLDLSVNSTSKAMEVLEKAYGKDNITTRNWKTIERIINKL